MPGEVGGMQVMVYPGQAGAARAAAEGRVVVIVDALRASSTIATLLHRGADEVLVVARVQQAHAWREAHPGAICVGERGGRQVPGFELGNSPLAILDANVRGRKVVFTSSNAAACFTAAIRAPSILAGTLLNASAVVRGVAEHRLVEEHGAALVPAGKHEDSDFITIEDWLSCGYLLRLFRERNGELVGEEARQALEMAQGLEAQDFAREFAAGAHGRHLASIGYGADIPFCTQIDRFDTVPVMTDVVELADGERGVRLK